MDTSERTFKICTFITSIFLAITAIVTLVISTVLITSFFVSHWGIWNDPLVIGPLLIIGLSIYQLFISVIGCINGIIDTRFVFISFVVLISIALTIQIAILIVNINAISDIHYEFFNKGKSLAFKEIEQYTSDSSIKDIWDDLQSKEECCGVTGKQDGYKVWFPNFHRVPDSCCRDEQQNCGESISKQTPPHNIGNLIYTEGCLDKLDRVMQDTVRPLMIICGIIGGANAIVELICIVLMSVYGIQISKRGVRSEQKQPKHLRKKTSKVMHEMRKSLTDRETRISSKGYVDEASPMNVLSA